MYAMGHADETRRAYSYAMHAAPKLIGAINLELSSTRSNPTAENPSQIRAVESFSNPLYEFCNIPLLVPLLWREGSGAHKS
eukprot:1180396-Prorocentrum_minimum.AAC.2